MYQVKFKGSQSLNFNMLAYILKYVWKIHTSNTLCSICERTGSGIDFLTLITSAKEPPSMYSRAMLICPESGM